MIPFTLEILAAQLTVFQGDVTHCLLETDHGFRGLEAGHEPYLAVLREGSELVWEFSPGGTSSGSGRVAVASGLLSFRDNLCRVLMKVEAGT